MGYGERSWRVFKSRSLRVLKITNNEPRILNHEPSTINPQSSTINYQPPTTNLHPITCNLCFVPCSFLHCFLVKFVIRLMPRPYIKIPVPCIIFQALKYRSYFSPWHLRTMFIIGFFNPVKGGVNLPDAAVIPPYKIFGTSY